VTSDDRRKLDRDAAGNQPPAPVARPTPPERLRSRSWTEIKTEKWFKDLARSPRDVVARALHQIDERPSRAGHPYELWSELDEEQKANYLRRADAALDAVAPLLRSPTFRSVTARRDAELRQALLLADQLNEQYVDAMDTQLRLEAQLQRYRESVRAMARIIQRKRAGANRQVAYYKRLYLNTTELLRRRQS
jgi:hypothetical protein